MLHVVLFAVHFQDEVDFLLFDQEALTIVLSNSCLDVVIDQDLFVVSLSVLSDALRLQGELLLEEISNGNLRRQLCE